MKKLIVFAFIGLLSQLIDGSLGMAYGVTSTSLLLAFGITPAVASASVHLAEVVTTAASGVSHIKFGNVDKQTVYQLVIPGSIGAFFRRGIPQPITWRCGETLYFFVFAPSGRICIDQVFISI